MLRRELSTVELKVNDWFVCCFWTSSLEDNSQNMKFDLLTS